jgi:type IV pilus assembly protein PilY1
MKRSRRRLLSTALSIALVATPPSFVAAEDIDLFVGTQTPLGSAGNPNVLVIIDNSANWAAQSQHWPGGVFQGQSELSALSVVVNELDDTINLGLMMLTAGTGGGAKDGGYVRYAIRPMTSANKAGLVEMLGAPDPTTGLPDPTLCDDTATNSITGVVANCIYKNFSSGPKNESVGTNVDYSATLFEAFKYFGGFTSPAHATDDVAGSPVVTTVPSAGFGPYRYSGNPDSRTDPAAYVTPLTTYRPPISDQNNCAKNYIIFIGNGFPTQDAPSSLLTAVGGTATQEAMPQVSTTTSTVTTALGTDAVCESNAACVTRATAIGGFDSYSCTGGTQNNPATFTDTVCHTKAQCEAQAAIDHPGFATYTCSGGNTVPGTCTGLNRINQTITATPANVCTGTNFLDQSMQGTRTVISVTFPSGAPSTVPAINEARWSDEWAKYLFSTDVNGSPTDNVGGQLGAPGQQNVTIFTIDVFKDNQDPKQTRLLYNMAKLGGGEYFQANSAQDIIVKLREALRKIQAKSSVFAAASLPVSATNRAQNENQVFFGLFRPDATANPRWYGNLKRYQIAKDIAGNLILAGANVDASGNPVNAINNLTGFFDDCAASFWTTDTTVFNTSTSPATDQSYWVFSPTSTRLDCALYPTATFSKFSDLPDGPVVEKGGAAEVLRRGNNPAVPTFTYSSTMRTMYTCADTTAANCPTAASPGMVAFDTTNVSEARVGVVGSTEQTRLIDYTRGKDVGNVGGLPLGDENSSNGTTDTRPSIHGDVVHSRPLPVNYGGSTGIVAYYGTNDGDLRAVRTSDGQELWSFIAPEHHARLKRLMENSPVIAFPNVIDPTAQPKDYFFDGTMGLYETFDDTTTPPTVTTAWIFPTMRRGGRMVYGFDVTTPAAPALKWRVGCPNLTDDTGCTAGFDGMGQTWSFPNVAKIKGYSSGTAPVIVIGGGYDSCEDSDTASPSCSGSGVKGKKVYVIDANNGAFVASFDTDRSVAADVAMIDRNFDGNVDHAYVVDTGGNLYRIDFINPSTLAPLASNAWTITKLASTSAGSGRKFLFAPAVLTAGDRTFLTFGSGDRERPLITNYPYTTPVANRFYTFMDTFPTITSPATVVDLDGTNMLDFTSVTTTAPSECLTPTSSRNGWRMDLVGGTGEQTVTSSLIAGGNVFFNTNRPLPAVAGTCNADLGEARGYSVNLLCGTKFSVIYEGGGLPISPVQGTTTLADGSVVTFIIGGPAGPGSTNPYAPGQVKPVISPTRSRMFWYRQGDK